jgi:FkbM family methyltransferase
MFNELIDEDIRVLHVGAHGAEEREIYEMFGIKDVYWVEPMAKQIRLLEKSVESHRIIPFAIWSNETTLPLHITTNSVSSSLFQVESVNPFNLEESRTEEFVDTLTLDTVLNKFIPDDCKPLLIVLDIQGSELEALKGLGNGFKQNVVAVVAEISEIPIYKGGATAVEVRSKMKDFGFRRYLSHVYSPTRHGDELFLNSSKRMGLKESMLVTLFYMLHETMHLLYRTRNMRAR